MPYGRQVVCQMTIADLKPGQSARVVTVGGEGALRQHFWIWALFPEPP